MTEPLLGAGDAAPAAALSAGALLRAARERQGLHIAALAAAIKVSPKKLEALEADRWNELPDATFVRALAQTVCRTLKIDARLVLDKLPSPPGVNLALSLPSGTDTGGAPTRAAAVAAPRGRSRVPPLAWGALLLLAGAAVLFFLPAGWTWRSSAPVAPPAVAASAALPVASVAPVASAAAAMVADVASAPVAGGASAPSVAASTPSDAVPIPPPPTATTAGTATATGALQLVVSEDSWIEVRDARGLALVSRMFRAGEQLGLDGEPPLRATIGNAAGTQLRWRGQSIDLVGRQQGNVARVELP
jgi:cytoskeleton protein RodZ